MHDDTISRLQRLRKLLQLPIWPQGEFRATGCDVRAGFLGELADGLISEIYEVVTSRRWSFSIGAARALVETSALVEYTAPRWWLLLICLV